MQSLIIQDFKFFAPVRIDEKNTFAHLDTGASGNMLADSEAKDLKRIGSRMMQGGIEQQEVEQVRIKRLEFLDEQFDNTDAIVFDGKEYFGEAPFPVSMTLGANALLAKTLILDFKRLWIGFAEKPLKEELPQFPMDCSTGLPAIPLCASGKKLDAIFDTGAAYSILNANRAQELGLLLEQIYSLEVQDPAGGKGHLPVYLLQSLQIGEIDLGKCELVIVNLDPVEQRLQKRIDLVLGANTMLTSALVWVLEKENNSLRVSERSIDVYE